MSKVRKVFALTGIILVLAAVLMSLKPGIVPEIALPLPQDLFLSGFLLVFMFLFGLYGLQSSRFGGIEDSDLKLNPRSSPEEAMNEEGKHSLEFGWDEHEKSREEIRETLIRVLMDKRNCSEEGAKEIYREGEWTDSKTAAAFICREISYPILERLKEWLEEKGTFERRRKKAVEEIEKLHEGEES